MRKNPAFRVSNKVIHVPNYQPAPLQRLTRKLKQVKIYDTFQYVNNKGANQVAWMHRLVCDFVVEDRFSRVDVQIMVKLYITFNF